MQALVQVSVTLNIYCVSVATNCRFLKTIIMATKQKSLDLSIKL
jgi:hypothetical protein